MSIFEDNQVKSEPLPQEFEAIMSSEEYNKLYMSRYGLFMLEWGGNHFTGDLSMQLSEVPRSKKVMFVDQLRRFAHDVETKAEALVAAKVIWMFVFNCQQLIAYRDHVEAELDYLESILGQ